MGRRKTQQQSPLFVSAASLPQSPAHPFYERLNRVLGEGGFDSFVEGLCVKFYDAKPMGRPSLEPGKYFRLLLLGYFEGIDSERGIAWRCADSLSLRAFVGYRPDERATEHSTISRTRRLIDLETHQAVFTWVLTLLARSNLLKGKTVGIDATTLEANAAMRSIVRNDTHESYEQFLTGLAKASGIDTPTREDLSRLDKKRKNKASNDDWHNPHDPDAKITKMKDGRTHLAHKQEHAVDMDSVRSWRSRSNQPTREIRPPGGPPSKRRIRTSTRCGKTRKRPSSCIRIRWKSWSRTRGITPTRP